MLYVKNHWASEEASPSQWLLEQEFGIRRYVAKVHKSLNRQIQY